MTTTTAMPELPSETVIAIGKKHFPKTTLSNAWFGFAADIALATLQAQPAEVSDAELRKAIDALRNPGTVSTFYNGFYTLTPDELRRAILALRPQSESEQEKELRRSLAEAQATISERNAEIIELQKRIHRSQQAVPMTEGDDSGIPGMFKTTCPWCENGFTTSLPSLDPVSTRARLLSSEELADCCGGCASNSAIETWMRRAIAKFCEVNGITAPAGGEGKA